MTGQTLSAYFAKNLLQSILFIFCLFFSLIVVVDLIELSRSLARKEDADFFSMFLVSLFRAPSFAEHILPFAVLFGAFLSLTLMNRRLELVVARASGVSVWQFLMPLILVAFGVGVFSIAIFNPIALKGQIASKKIESRLYEGTKKSVSKSTNNFWIRLHQKDADVVIRAKVSQDHGVLLTAVTAYQFDKNGLLTQRIDADRGQFKSEEGKNFYLLKNANLTIPGEQVKIVDSIELPVRINKSDLQNTQMDAGNISIWELFKKVENAENTGNNSLPFVTQIYSMASQPLLFVAMVLLAGTFSLTFTRFGLNKKVVLGGVLAGFVLYISTKLVITFGSNGLVPPFIATWTPALIATLICMTVLLYQEDG